MRMAVSMLLALFCGAVYCADPSVEAVNRARDQVKMLDDLYKTAVVLITDKYVHETTDFSAGSAAAALFEAMENKGYHRVRLLDATGDPYAAKNVAQDDFEKKGIEELRNGKATVEKIESSDSGTKYFRALTPVPVVMQKCTMCHPHYADVPKGQIIGVLSYKLEIK